jgi:hypothetical protein
MFDNLKYSRFNSGELNLMFFGGMKTLVKKIKENRTKPLRCFQTLNCWCAFVCLAKHTATIKLA